jgi:hypothetical protein
MQVPTFPDLDNASCDDGSVDKSEDVAMITTTTTTTTSIKQGGEDSDPRPPMRHPSPKPSAPKKSAGGGGGSNNNNNNNNNNTNTNTNGGGGKLSSHRKISQKTRLSSNPLDAFDRSPEQGRKTPLEYGYEDAARSSSTTTSTTSTTRSPQRSTITRSPPRSSTSITRSPPPQSMSSGAAKALRRGVPAAEAFGLMGMTTTTTTTTTNGGVPIRRPPPPPRPPPNRSNLKKSSSFHSPRSTLMKKQQQQEQQQQQAAAAPAANNATFAEEPMRGLTRRASMGSNTNNNHNTTTTTIEVRVRGERFPVQRRRSINFDKRVEIKEVEPVTNLVGNCSEIWLQEEDFAKMKQDRRNLVREIKKSGGVLPSSAESEDTGGMRGLEKYVDKSIRAVKNLAWDTVLLEQDEQELSGDYNEERIADLYRHFTRESPDKAWARAKQDQEEIQDYLLSPRTTKLMLRRLPAMVHHAASTTANTANTSSSSSSMVAAKKKKTATTTAFATETS